MHFDFGRRPRRKRQSTYKPFTRGGLAPSYDGPVPAQKQPEPVGGLARKETSTRFVLTAITSACLFVTLLFMIMVEIGNTANKDGLRHIWFFKVQFVNIPLFANDVPVGLGYGLAESLHLYDFYQVGLWNYCEGNNSTGLAKCRSPDARYWFNPLDIVADQLNSTINLPRSYDRDVHTVRTCSHWMFGLFMLGAVLSFVLIPVVFIGMSSRWYSVGLSIITFINAICILAATIIATALFAVLKKVFREYIDILNLAPKLGATMFAMMWIASFFSICAFGLQATLSCCFTSKRELRRARQKSFM